MMEAGVAAAPRAGRRGSARAGSVSPRPPGRAQRPVRASSGRRHWQGSSTSRAAPRPRTGRARAARRGGNSGVARRVRNRYALLLLVTLAYFALNALWVPRGLQARLVAEPVGGGVTRTRPARRTRGGTRRRGRRAVLPGRRTRQHRRPRKPRPASTATRQARTRSPGAARGGGDATIDEQADMAGVVLEVTAEPEQSLIDEELAKVSAGALCGAGDHGDSVR